MVVFWIVVALAFAVAEVATLALFAAFFAIAALGGALAAALGGDFLVQALVVLAASVAGVVGARPPLMRYLQRTRSFKTQSGADEMIGKTAVVVERIKGADDHEVGHVRLMGERWPAVSDNNIPVEPGIDVKVVAIRRATLVVEPQPGTATVVEGKP